jgi:hypothetical protein
MTLDTSIELEDLDRRLKGFHETYKVLPTTIKDELKAINTPQAEHDTEIKNFLQTDNEVSDARKPIKKNNSVGQTQ